LHGLIINPFAIEVNNFDDLPKFDILYIIISEREIPMFTSYTNTTNFEPVDDVVLTPEEVSVILKIDVDSIKRYCRQGELPAFQVGAQWRIQKSKLDEWIKSQYQH
jgi:excisionase family DNA binding protein